MEPSEISQAADALQELENSGLSPEEIMRRRTDLFVDAMVLSMLREELHGIQVG